MRAVAIRAFGRPEGLAVIDVPSPHPADGQVLVAVEAIGVGGFDAVIRSGAIAGLTFTEGHILGSEVAGTVTAVGDGVDPSWTGQRVWAFTGLGGGYVEQAIAPVEEILALPAGLSAVDAVTLGSSGVVAHFALAQARFVRGESVLVRGAAGSIGIMTVQLAARDGVGEDDALIDAGEREQIRTALADAGVDHEVVSYPGVGHAFFWPGTPAFSSEARDDAWRRIVDLLAF